MTNISFIMVGDVRVRLRELPDECVNTVVTSPPYFGLRDYGNDGQIGLENTPERYVAELVSVFEEVKRVLRNDGTVWLNLGDSYHADGRKGRAHMGIGKNTGYSAWMNKTSPETKPKDILGIPWMVAFALRSNGWYLRQDIIWHKPNVMPESVKDRCTKAHEYVFLLSKQPNYYFDHEAIKEPAAQPDRVRADRIGGNKYVEGIKHSDGSIFTGSQTRNRRSVWSINTKPFRGAHFAVFPEALVEPCVLAGSPTGGMILDPFGGSGTTGVVANRLGRDAILCEINPDYAKLAQNRIEQAGYEVELNSIS